MCGIFFTNDPSFHKKDVDSILTSLRKRGPDHEAYNLNPLFCMAHTRLSITGLGANANQPLTSKSGKFTIVFNGEIYNYVQLAKKFNIRLQFNSDTELIIELYELIGEAALGYLNGMFAFVIVDNDTGDFFAAVDRFSVKPIYYTVVGGFYYLSSQVNTLLNYSDLIFNYTAIECYKFLRLVPPGETIYKNINQLKPSEYMFNGKINNYFKLNYEFIHNENYIQETTSLIVDSINIRIPKEVEFTTFLSGGVDSSIVTGISKPAITYSVGFQDANEFDEAQEFANLNRIYLKRIIVTRDEFLETAKNLILESKVPLATPNEVLIHILCNQARQDGFKVILSGEGADEAFLGYDRIYNWSLNNTFKGNEFIKYYAYDKSCPNHIIESIFNSYNQFDDNFIKIEHFFIDYHLPNLLRRLDSATMASSIECREPFMDYRLIQLGLSIPPSLRIKDGISKSPLKTSFTKLLGNNILKREKIGFKVPLDLIFNTTENNAYKTWLDFNLRTLEII